MKKLFTIVGLCVANLANAAKVPEKRNFPLSKKLKPVITFTTTFALRLWTSYIAGR